MNPQGNTSSGGQVLQIGSVVALSHDEFPSNLTVTADSTDPSNVTVVTTLDNDAGLGFGDWAGAGGGEANAGDASAIAPGGTIATYPYGTNNVSVTLTGVSNAIVNTDPSNVALAAFENVVSSTSSQASEGTNVSPGAGWGGWRSEERDVEQATTPPPCDGTGWCPSIGEYAAAAGITSIGSSHSESSGSDNISISASNPDGGVDFDLDVEGDGNTSDYVYTFNTTAETSGANSSSDYTSLYVYAYDEFSHNVNVTNAQSVNYTGKPSNTNQVILQNVTVSDWNTATTGSGGIFNNGWGGWGQQPQGWNAQPPSGWSPSTS